MSSLHNTYHDREHKVRFTKRFFIADRQGGRRLVSIAGRIGSRRMFSIAIAGRTGSRRMFSIAGRQGGRNKWFIIAGRKDGKNKADS